MEEFQEHNNIHQLLAIHNFDRVINSSNQSLSSLNLPRISPSTARPANKLGHKFASSQTQCQHKFNNLHPELVSQFSTLLHFHKQIMPLPVPCKSCQIQSNKKILALDLDETLILTLEVPVSQYKDTLRTHKITVGKSTYHFIERPYLQQFLEDMSQYYTLVVFTASSELYAQEIVNIIDPHHLISSIYSKSNCSKAELLYIKDLRTVTDEMKSIVLLDNNLSSLGNQLSNGVWIQSFNGERTDSWLPIVSKLLKRIVHCIDIRDGLKLELDYEGIFNCISDKMEN